MTRTISLETDERGVARLTLNRPERHNAMSSEMISELAEAARSLGDDSSVRAVVLTGAGPSFCAGADLNWMRAQFDADRQTRMAEARALAHMLRAMDRMPKPLIGRINGSALGGGLGLMAVCDVALVADRGKFGFTETRLGLIPATIAPYVLARMGPGKARRVFMSGRTFGPEELPPLNLAARVLASDTLDAEIEAEVAPYLDAMPAAVADAKALARDLAPPIDDETIEATVSALADCWERPETRARIEAFLTRK
ncbi:crotonase/enoyl-CoA hydratase family protein [Halovulum sp. GXIMD14794]